jgi:hypothetical protein
MLTYMLIFGKRFFPSGLAILQSLDFVGRALPAINNLKSSSARDYAGGKGLIELDTLD